jgi:hypothetical protein
MQVQSNFAIQKVHLLCNQARTRVRGSFSLDARAFSIIPDRVEAVAITHRKFQHLVAQCVNDACSPLRNSIAPTAESPAGKTCLPAGVASSLMQRTLRSCSQAMPWLRDFAPEVTTFQ